ncbi:hypothetical protein ACAW74_23185 [Fibrella sp. WM1]|uniref:hypothetical protein n=1 Tax=Fibrella musci TaxID=3242485 RepID=UPI00352125F7
MKRQGNGLMLTLWVSLLVVCQSVAQSSISLHPLVDTTQSDIRQAVTLWTTYLRSRPDSLYDNPYWNDAEKQAAAAFGGRFDLLEREFEPTLYRGYPVQILSVVNYNGLYQIKSLFGGNNPKGRSPNLVAITNVYARPGTADATAPWQLYNALPINRDKLWQGLRVGYVQYYFPRYHVFDKRKALQLNDFIEQLCRDFSVPPQAIEYYLADTAEELRQLRGIDYEATLSGASKPTGRAVDNRVFCSGLGEFYPHEVVHVLLNPHFPNQHPWVVEGVATWLGGSRGQPLSWHLHRTATYLTQHPELNLANLLTLRNLDEYTDYRYALGGLLCQLIHEKGDYPLLKQVMNAGRTDAVLYQAIDTYLGVPRPQLNTYLREKLRAYL